MAAGSWTDAGATLINLPNIMIAVEGGGGEGGKLCRKVKETKLSFIVSLLYSNLSPKKIYFLFDFKYGQWTYIDVRLRLEFTRSEMILISS